MTEQKTKEELRKQQEKDVLNSMKLARDNMTLALGRIQALESALANAQSLYNDMIQFVPERAYPYGNNTSYKETFASRMNKILEVR